MLNPHLFISIHLNAFKGENVSGGQVFTQNSENSINLGNILQERFNLLSNKNKKSKIGDYYILNKTKVNGVLIECGFLSNDEERKKLLSEEYQKLLADEIVNGIYEYFLIN